MKPRWAVKVLSDHALETAMVGMRLRVQSRRGVERGRSGFLGCLYSPYGMGWVNPGGWKLLRRRVRVLAGRPIGLTGWTSVCCARGVGSECYLVVAGVFRRGWRAGVVAEDWPLGVAVPVYNKSDPLDVSNYSLVTLMSHLAKVTERVILGRNTDDRK